jgi:hypothetical protein
MVLVLVLYLCIGICICISKTVAFVCGVKGWLSVYKQLLRLRHEIYVVAKLCETARGR